MVGFFRTFTASSGVVEHRFDYACTSCAEVVPALVRTSATGAARSIGGFGGDAKVARQQALDVAHARAARAVAEACCPRCGALPTSVRSERLLRHRRLARARRYALPIALLAGIAPLASLTYPAVADLTVSSALLVFTCALAVAMFTTAHALVGWHARSTPEAEATIFFWRPDAGVRAPSWAHAPQPAPPADPPNTVASIELGVAAVAWVVVALALFAFASTYRAIYVIDAAAAGGIIHARVDGYDVPLTTVGAEDVRVRRLTVRTGQAHRVDLVDDAGMLLSSYAVARSSIVDAAPLLVTVEGAGRVCFVESESVYGRPDAAPREGAAPGSATAKARLVVPDGQGIVTLSRQYEDLFRESPPSQEIRAGEVVSRWALRAVPCASIDGSVARDR